MATCQWRYRSWWLPKGYIVAGALRVGRIQHLGWCQCALMGQSPNPQGTKVKVSFTADCAAIKGNPIISSCKHRTCVPWCFAVPTNNNESSSNQQQRAEKQDASMLCPHGEFIFLGQRLPTTSFRIMGLSLTVSHGGKTMKDLKFAQRLLWLRFSARHRCFLVYPLAALTGTGGRSPEKEWCWMWLRATSPSFWPMAGGGPDRVHVWHHDMGTGWYGYGSWIIIFGFL